MNRERRKFIWIFLLGLVVSTISACSGNEASPAVSSPMDIPEAGMSGGIERTGSGLYEFGKEPLHFTFYAHYSYYTMPQWGADPSSKWIRDHLKIDIEAVSAEGNAAQKLQKMIAGKKLSDMIWGQRDSDLERLREVGLLVPLDDYIEKYPNLRKWAGPKILNMLRASDGHIYYFPNYYTNRPYGNAGYVVNKRIYRELGSPKLETTDDLYQYLKRVKARYPDVIPFETGLAKEGNGIDQLFSAFKEDNFSFTRYLAVTSEERMTSIYKDEGFRQSAMYVAKLMREGLMTPDALTQTEDQVSEKLMKDRVAVFASADPIKMAMKANAELSRKNPENGYFFIDPIYKQGLDKSKIYPGTYNVLGWNVMAITAGAKNPEAIFAMLDWMTGPEGSAVQMWGPPGPDGYWDGFKEDGMTPNFTSKYSENPNNLTEIQSISGDLIWVGNTVYLDQTKSEYEATLPEKNRNWSTYWQNRVTWKSQGDATPFINLYPLPDTEEGAIYRGIKDIWLKARVNAMYGKTDEEVLSILDSADDESMDLGFQRYLDFITSKWRANVKLLNTE
ncbi:extracellular solute-binding protein [Paenibacillus sp.]|jgi:ABC-type glycerol-3-phosphate transport system substrate-binding protein|uniref:extracellular solute-binding protein n=1 Tax=Paenibacillus sp. TaxID=58172 RepID=UPI0028221F8B|nr:extracellular solute-binding protein [Paenibacillus sp.]MDR0268087.1 extracellular solute-binding protein [Paenibacillus sp.]